MKIIKTKLNQPTMQKAQTNFSTKWIRPYPSVLVFLFIFFTTTVLQAQDTVYVEFGDSSKVVIHIQNANDAEALKDLDWNLIMARTAGYIDEAHQNHEEGTEKQIELETEKNKEEEYKKSSRTFSIGTGGIRFEKNNKDDDNLGFWRRTRHQLHLDLGFNNYFEDNEFGKTPTGKPYELRSWGARYAAFGSTFKTQIGGKRSPLLIQYGLEASWYNFMYSGDDRVIETENGILFTNFDYPLDKSKLTVAYLNLPTMLHLDFASEDKTNLKLAVGGYVGYRIGSYTKIVYNQDGDRQKDKEHANFSLNDWRYGARLELGIGEDKFDNGFRLFFNYDLNPLFTEDTHNPTLNAFSFGVRI